MEINQTIKNHELRLNDMNDKIDIIIGKNELFMDVTKQLVMLAEEVYALKSQLKIKESKPESEPTLFSEISKEKQVREELRQLNGDLKIRVYYNFQHSKTYTIVRLPIGCTSTKVLYTPRVGYFASIPQTYMINLNWNPQQFVDASGAEKVEFEFDQFKKIIHFE